MTTGSVIEVTLNHSIAQIKINYPEKKNALTMAMYAAMTKALVEADNNSEIRVILIQGTSTVFTSGNDLQDFMNFKPDGSFESNPVHGFLHQISHTTKPIIAAVSGPAIGIGTTMLLHCDLVYADDNAIFQLPFVNLGLCPEAASSFLLPKLAGYHRAAELLLFGEPFSAQSAKEIGLVNSVTYENEALKHAFSRAEQLVKQPPTSIRLTKQLLKQNQMSEVKRTMMEESQLFVTRLASPEAKEAFTAFFEKRKPDFSNFN